MEIKSTPIKASYQNLPGRLAAVCCLVRAGARYETLQNNGIAHLIEHIIALGGKEFKSQLQFYSQIESLGAYFTARTSHEYTQYSIIVPFKNLEPALNILFHLLKYPNFSSYNINHEKNIILEEFYSYLEKNKKGQIIDPWYNMQKLLWPKSALSFNIMGTASSLKAIKPKQIKDAYKQWYTNQNCALGIAAPSLSPTIKTSLKKFSLTSGKVQKIPAAKKQGGNQQYKFINADKDYLAARLGFRGVGYNSPLPYLLQLLISAILGEGSGSYLMRQVRQKEQLVYSVWSDPTSYTNTGRITLGFDCSPQKLIPALQQVLQVINSLKTQTIGRAELRRAQGYLEGGITLDESRPGQVSFRLAQDALFGYPLSPQAEINQLYQFTAEDVRRYARKIFTLNNQNFLLIGPDAKKYAQEIPKLIKTV